jgi:copper chaperone CopZ
MKNAFFSLFTALAMIVMTGLPAQAEHTTGTPEKIQAGEINKTGTLIQIGVNGLVCDFCARALEKVFMKRSDIAGIDVNLDDSRVIISLKDDADIDDETLRKLVTDAGYNVSGITRKPGHG